MVGRRGGKRVARKGGKRRGKRASKWNKGPNTVAAVKTLSVPDRMLLKLPYYEALKFSGNSAAVYDFNLNSIWDPNRTGGGHQPLGTDQWGALYRRYRVYGCTVRFSATNLGDVPARIGMIADNLASGTSYLSNESKFEQPHMKSFILGNAQGFNTRTIKMFYSCAKVQGSPKSRYNSDNQFQAQWNTSPAENIVGHIVASSLDNTTALNIAWDVHIIYHIEAFDRYALTLSNTSPELRGPEYNRDDESSMGPTGPTGDAGVFIG